MIWRAQPSASRTIWPPQKVRTFHPTARRASRFALSAACRSGVWWFSQPSQKTATFWSGQAKSMWRSLVLSDRWSLARLLRPRRK